MVFATSICQKRNMSHTLDFMQVVPQKVQMEARKRSFWASCCRPGRGQRDRQHQWGVTDSCRGQHSPQHLLSTGQGQKDCPGDMRTALWEWPRVPLVCS